MPLVTETLSPLPVKHRRGPRGPRGGCDALAGRACRHVSSDRMRYTSLACLAAQVSRHLCSSKRRQGRAGWSTSCSTRLGKDEGGCVSGALSASHNLSRDHGAVRTHFLSVPIPMICSRNAMESRVSLLKGKDRCHKRSVSRKSTTHFTRSITIFSGQAAHAGPGGRVPYTTAARGAGLSREASSGGAPKKLRTAIAEPPSSWPF